MNKKSNRDKFMFDYLTEANILKKFSSGIYILPSNGINFLKKLERIILDSILKYSNVSWVDFPLIVRDNLIDNEIIENYGDISFWTSNRSNQKYILNSDIQLYENFIIKDLKNEILFSSNIRFRNKYAGSVSKKTLLQYHAFELAFDYEKEWENIRKWISDLGKILNIKLILRKNKGNSNEYNIIYLGKRNLAVCKECKNIIVVPDKCCGEFEIINENITYKLAHIVIKDNNIGYFGISFEHLIGAIFEKNQFGRWCLLPSKLENRKIIISDLDEINSLCSVLISKGYSILKSNLRVADFKGKNDCLVIGFDKKRNVYIIYDGYFKTMTKVNYKDLNKIFSEL